jgi:hypothetical protein
MIKISEDYPLHKANIFITLYTCRLMDYDGAYGSIKPILDGLTDNGIIIDDSPKFIKLNVTQIKVNKKCDERVEMEITEIKKR